MAHRRLRHEHAFGGARDVLFFHEEVERHEQVDVEIMQLGYGISSLCSLRARQMRHR
jgi:hypothetical protein